MPAARKRGGGYSLADKIIDLNQQQDDDTISRKYIRNTGKYGGMVSYDKHYDTPRQMSQEPKKTPIMIIQDVENTPPPSQFYQGPQDSLHLPPQTLPQIPPPVFIQNTPPPVVSPPTLTCIDICNHIEKCPICSKFYHNDKSIYIVIIILLLVLCALLIKKIVEK
jgi:hypothetical protein